MLPDKVLENNLYAASADYCTLKDLGEKPLWSGIEDKGVRQQMRFTFAEGVIFSKEHGLRMLVVDFTEREDGSGRIALQVIRHDENGRAFIEERLSYRVKVEDVVTLNRLGDSSGNWRFPSGSWDSDENEDDLLFSHCDVLEMERIGPQGYRYASVNIGCNQPDKLMPLVDFVTGLTGFCKWRPQPRRFDAIC